MTKGRQFSSGKVELVTCRGCGKRTTSGIDGCLGLELCRDCFDEANWENAHSDGHPYDDQDECPFCKKEAQS